MSNLARVTQLSGAKIKVINTLSCIVAASLLLSSCSNSGSPTPAPTKTVYLPAPSQNNGILGNSSQNDLQDQLDSAKQAACDSAEVIQRQWIQLNGQVIEMDGNRFGRTSGTLDLDLDAQIAQLRYQVFQLQQQEENLRQLCNS
jgi:hypothetical protein